MTRVLISGSRNWADEDCIRKVIYSFPPESVLIVGDARGADEIARKVAQERGDIIVLQFNADWNKHGKRAGPIRNIEMFNEDPDEVYIFQIDNSKGTGHAIRLAEEKNIKLTKFNIVNGVRSWINYDDLVEEWHKLEYRTTLHKFLGMTWEQYKLWVENKGV